jgi:four helix bundle protein
MSIEITSFKDLIVWQRSMQLVKEVYILCGKLPKSEVFNLCSQMQRSAVSIPSNISEGKKRGTKKDFSQFLRIASGSAAELETQLLITKELYATINTEKPLGLVIEVQKMLATIIKKFQQDGSPISYKL